MSLGPEQIALSDGRSIPQLGFGVWQVPEDEAEQVVLKAIETGYRSIDTAEAYYNEEGVGAALRASGLSRSDFFLTTKLWNTNQGYDRTMRAFERSLARLGTDHVDLYLMHWPSQSRDLYVETWKAFVELHRQGAARSIGVSNFAVSQLERIIQQTGEVPVVNQVELHPRFQQRELRGYHSFYGIVTESWSPLGQWKGARPSLEDPSIRRIALAHGKTPAQVILRWHLDSGLVPLSKSVTPSRIAENFDIFDFRLTPEDLAVIAAMDARDGRMGPEPETAQF